jgi:hypothetical protein
MSGGGSAGGGGGAPATASSIDRPDVQGESGLLLLPSVTLFKPPLSL